MMNKEDMIREDEKEPSGEVEVTSDPEETQPNSKRNQGYKGRPVVNLRITNLVRSGLPDNTVQVIMKDDSEDKSSSESKQEEVHTAAGKETPFKRPQKTRRGTNARQ
mmetsp:Transcript_42942/g.62930  ORF Transcript_42942/g.62930 Transcript_42942/m.62930 type:complete len:107 (-) Transcript_42942:73-393(-)